MDSDGSSNKEYGHIAVDEWSSQFVSFGPRGQDYDGCQHPTGNVPGEQEMDREVEQFKGLIDGRRVLQQDRVCEA